MSKEEVKREEKEIRYKWEEKKKDLKSIKKLIDKENLEPLDFIKQHDLYYWFDYIHPKYAEEEGYEHPGFYRWTFCFQDNKEELRIYDNGEIKYIFCKWFDNKYIMLNKEDKKIVEEVFNYFAPHINQILMIQSDKRDV